MVLPLALNRCLGAFLAIGLAAPLVAEQTTAPPQSAPVLRAEDAARLDQLEAALGRALRSVLTLSATDSHRQAALAALSGGAQAGVALTDLEGDWSCRMIKMGGNLPAVTYDPFRCRIHNGRFEKLTGSQRTRGQIVAQDGRLIYLGTSFVAGETPPAYRDLPVTTDPRALPQHFPDVALVESVSPDHLRLLFPQPWLESAFNILELRR